MSETGTATKQWYVVHTYSGFENKVAAAIESRAKIFGLQDMRRLRSWMSKFSRIVEASASVRN